MKKFAFVASLVLSLAISAAALAAVTVQEQRFEKDSLKIIYPKLVGTTAQVSGNVDRYFQKEIKSAQKDYKKQQKQGDISIYMNYYEEYNGPALICFRSLYSEYWKGALHPMSTQDGIAFDLKDGDAITDWRDLINGKDAHALNLDAINKMIFASKESWREALYPEFKGLKKLPKKWYIHKDGTLHFLFANYEIAPYVAGIIDLPTGKKCKYVK